VTPSTVIAVKTISLLIFPPLRPRTRRAASCSCGLLSVRHFLGRLGGLGIIAGPWSLDGNRSQPTATVLA
jgi:hypothetical protein